MVLFHFVTILFCFTGIYLFSYKRATTCLYYDKTLSTELDMEKKEEFSLVDDAEESSISSRNSRITEFLELCIQPETRKEMDNILVDFWAKYEACKSENDLFSETDVVCMYSLDYVYEHNSTSVSSVSRSLYAYLCQMEEFLKGNNRNCLINCSKGCFLAELRQFTNLYAYVKCEDMLVDANLGCIIAGNLGLARFLIKFGLIQFPDEVNEKMRKMMEILVQAFNSHAIRLFGKGEEDMKTTLESEILLNRMKECPMSLKRAVFTLCYIVMLAEYEMFEMIRVMLGNLEYFEDKKKWCVQKLICLDLVISETTETKITYIDIERFVSSCLNPHLKPEVGKYLVKISKKIIREVRKFYNPRSLKDLARCKVRGCLQNSMMSEPVSKLDVPDVLKDFLLFHKEGIWDLIKANLQSLHTTLRLMNYQVSETESSDFNIV